MEHADFNADKVLIRSNGILTYTAKDIAYHLYMVINVIDYRQEYPQKMVKQALQALGFEKQASQLRHVSYGEVFPDALLQRQQSDIIC